MADLGDIVTKLKLDKSDFDKNVSDAQSKIGSFGQKATSAIDKLNKSPLGQITQSVTGFSLASVSAVGLASKAIQEFVQFTKEAVDETANYASQIDNLSRLTGNNSEETSRLIQLNDDLFISYDTLKTAMEGAAKKGIDTSTESLMRMSDEYKNLTSNIDKNQYLVDNFGRSGLEIKKFMELGADGIKAKMGAVSSSIVMDEKAVQKTIAYKKSIDDLNDAMSGVKYQLANEVIPAMTDLNTVMAYVIENTTQLTGAHNTLELGLEAFLSVVSPALLTSYQGASTAIHEWATKINEAADNTDHASDRYDNMNRVVSEVAETYTTSYSKMTGWINDFMDLEGKSADEVEKASRRIVLSMLQDRLAADGELDDQETNYLLHLGQQWGIFSDTAIKEMQDAMNQAKAYQSVIDGLKSKTITITTVYNSIYTSSGGNVAPSTTAAYHSQNLRTNALGGTFTIPKSYGTEGFVLGGMATASAGETVTINRENNTDKLLSQMNKTIENLKLEIDYYKLASAIKTEFQKA